MGLLKDHVHFVVKDIFTAKGEVYHKIIVDWRQIVGEKIQSKVIPVKLSKSLSHNSKFVLTVETKNHCDILEVQMMSQLILSKISQYFGKDVVSKINITLSKSSDVDDNKVLSTKINKQSDISDIEDILNQIKDPDLKEKLLNIAKTI
ncbi:MAG: hypothetical protein ACI8ZF_000523 [Candidatus Midichloriaceae bacterium]|jgi:hypothetical protein